MITEEAGLAEAEANFLENQAQAFLERAKGLREIGQRLAKEEADAKLVSRLEGLPFIEARSRKCYWIMGADVPQELKDLITRDKDGFKTEKHHYTLTKDGNVLRFDRHKDEPEK